MKEDYFEELIEEKFRGVYSRLDSNFELIHHKINEIHKETKLTNGRVTKLEDQFKCHEKEVQDVMFFLRHPKLFFGIILVVTIISLATFLNTNPFKIFDPLYKTEQTENNKN